MRVLVLASILALAAGAARAETVPGGLQADTPAPALRLPEVLTLGPAPVRSLAFDRPDAPLLRPKGTVQTAVDHQFSQSALGSLGYLCGLGEMANASGGMASAFEPMGTFLGGQFKLAF